MRRPLLLAFMSLLLAALSGCGGSTPAASSSPTPAPALSVSTSTLSFGTVAAGATSGVQSVTLTNTGTATLTVSSISLSDTLDFGFASNSCITSLAPSASCVVSVVFKPIAQGSFSAALSIFDNATPNNLGLVVSGTATAAPAPIATLSPTSLAFGNGPVGFTSAPQTVTLTNTGNATLTFNGTTLSDSYDFSVTTTCGTTLAAAAACTFSVTSHPQAAGTLSVFTSASTSPQAVALSVTGVVPAVTLSAGSITFPATTISTTASASITVTNSGKGPLIFSSLTLGGANASSFSETNTCSVVGTGASCTVYVNFTPAAVQSYTATLTLTDNAPGSPQTITLAGSGAAAPLTRVLYTFPESDNSVTPLYAMVNAAQKTIDMTMYELQDTAFDNDLIAACARGVRVRVILSASEKTNNTPAYNALNTASITSTTAGANCSAVFSNTAFTNTHQKTITVDNASTAIMTLNLQSQYYSTTRDFALVENDPADIAAIEATFAADYAAGTPYGGSQGASDFTYTPALGDDLIWSPTTAQAAMEGIINNAQSTLLIENEELASSAGYIVNDLVAACQRGVIVHFTIVDESSYEAQFTTLKNAGCSVHTYADTSTGFYVHAKVVVADYGLNTQNVYLGSINYSNASMNQNRELGIYLSDIAAVQTLYTTLTADYNGGTPW